MRINLEAQAKIYIQGMIRDSKLTLVTSYILEYENDCNRFSDRRNTVKKFIDKYASFYVGVKHQDTIESSAKEIMSSGVKEKDAIHIACAILAECAYFISTDDRLLKYKTDKITLVTPNEFLRRLESEYNV